MPYTIKLTYNGVTVERELGTKAKTNPVFRENRIRIAKHGLVMSDVIEKMLADGIITKDNLYVAEDGTVTHRLLYKTISKDIEDLYDQLCDELAEKVIVE